MGSGHTIHPNRISALESEISAQQYLEGSSLSPPPTARKSAQPLRIEFHLPLSDTKSRNELHRRWEEVIDSSKALKKTTTTIYHLNAQGEKIASWDLINSWVYGFALGPLSKDDPSSIVTERFKLMFDGVVQGINHTKRKPPNPFLSNQPSSESNSGTVPSSSIHAQELLKDAYLDHPKFNHSPQRIRKHMQGVDFNQPVTKKMLQPGEQIVQFERINESPGNYAAYPGSRPDNLGIDVGRRIEKHFIVTDNFSVIESTAAPFPGGKVSGVGGSGGARQILLPPNWETKVRLLPSIRKTGA